MREKGFTLDQLTRVCVFIAWFSVGIGGIPTQNRGGENDSSKTTESQNSKPVLSFHFLSVMNSFGNPKNANESEKADTKRTEILNVANEFERNCVLQNRSSVDHGKTFKENCATFTCVDGQIEGPESPTYRVDCPKDFDIVSRVGCVKLFTKPERTWCEAREKCFSLGADLVSLSPSSRDLRALARYVRREKDFKGETYVGFHRISPSEWKWTIGDQSASNIRKLFAKTEPNFKGPSACTRLMGDSLSDLGCDTNRRSSIGFAYVCEVPGFD